MLRVETHCHTIYSKDSLVRPEDLLKACDKKGIDRVVISDHNTTRGAFEAQKLDPQRVIIGGEILVIFGIYGILKHSCDGCNGKPGCIVDNSQIFLCLIRI